MRIGGGAVSFLIVDSQMLDAGAFSGVLLYTAGDCGSKSTGQVWIFRVILEVSPTQRIAMNVHARSKPEIDSQFVHLGTCHITGKLRQLRIPCLGNLHGHGQRGTILIFDLRTA